MHVNLNLHDLHISFQEIEFFTNSLNQLKLAQSKYVESQESLNKVSPESKDKEILVPLTSSVSFSYDGKIRSTLLAQ